MFKPLKLPFVWAAASALVSTAALADPWVQSGYAATALDVSRLVRQSVDSRMTENMAVERRDGGSVWLDLSGSTDETDTVNAAGGWSTDMWAAKLGADIKKGDSFFGVVYTYAYAESESNNTARRSDSESDWFGIQVFGQQRFGNFAVGANLGWLHSHGEGRYEASGPMGLHSNVFNGDISARLHLEAATLSIVPYVKAETTLVSPRNYDNGGAADDIVLHQFPIGVNVSRSFEAGGWSIRPVFDLALIRTAGDTQTETHYAGAVSHVQWIDDGTLYRAQAGLSAQSEKARLGLNYEYLRGDEGRKAHTVDLRAQYVF